MQTESYKSRTKDVRKSARAHLVELRKARLAGRNASLSEAVSLEELPQPTAESHASITEEPAKATEFVSEKGAEKELPAPEDPETSSKIDAASVGDPFNDLAVRNAAMAEMSETGESRGDMPNETQSELEVVTPKTIEPESVEPELDDIARPDDTKTYATPESEAGENANGTWQESALATLPGAGPGLVWMLNQCGVRTLEELAEQETALLSEKLGLVGLILDVSQWIAIAREQINHPEP